MANYKQKLFELLKERDGLICRICGGSLEEEWKLYQLWLRQIPKVGDYTQFTIKRKACNITIDHKIPKSILRKTPGFVLTPHWTLKDLTNLQLAHGTCNLKKANKLDYVPTEPLS